MNLKGLEQNNIDRVYDCIQSLEWLRYLLSSTNRGATGEYIVAYDLKDAKLIHRYCSKCLDSDIEKDKDEIYYPNQK